MDKRFTFTLDALKKIKAPADRDRIYVYDIKTTGLCMCITKRNARVFYHYRKINGRPERNRIGAFPPLTVEQARDAADRLNGRIASGENPAEERRTKRSEMTIAELFDRYMSDFAKVHKKSWKFDQMQYDLYMSSWKNRKLSSIHRRDAQELHTAVGEKHGKYAANRLMGMISKMFGFAAKTFDYVGNPAKGVTRFAEESRERFLAPDEMARFLKALEDCENDNVADFFRLSLFTGARRSNVAAMAWSDVNFSRRMWTVPKGDSKNGKALSVYLPEPAVIVLQRRWANRTEGDKFVFPGIGKHGHIVAPVYAWKNLLDEAKIDGLRIHDLRRSLGSWMASGGTSLQIIGKALGHQNERTTKIYARLTMDPIMTSVDAATTAMMQAATAEAEARTPAKKAKKKRSDRMFIQARPA